MTNNDEGKMNTDNNNSLLKYSTGTSYTHLSDPVNSSEGSSTPETTEHPPVQFESRRARRMSETSMMQQIPVPAVKEPGAAEPTVKETPVVKEISAPPGPPVLTTVPSGTSRKALKEKHKDTQPKKIIPVTEPSSISPNGKTYWGGTAMLMSLLVFLVGQVIWAALLIGYLVFSSDVLSQTQQQLTAGNENAVVDLLSRTPWLVVAALFANYISWLSCMWWVTRYRSGLSTEQSSWQGLKDSAFWAAFRNNFRLNNFKKRDIAYGAGIAVLMIAFQYFISTVVPQLFPELKSQIESSGNTASFGTPNDISFYLIGVGLVAIASPICEELFFRGFLLTGFSNHFSYKNSGRNMDILEDGFEKQASGLKSMLVTYRAFTHKHQNVIALILTSVIFGIMHVQLTSWVTSVYTGILGLVLGIVALKANRLYPSIFAHIFHNSIVFAFAAITMSR